MDQVSNSFSLNGICGVLVALRAQTKDGCAVDTIVSNMLITPCMATEKPLSKLSS